MRYVYRSHPDHSDHLNWSELILASGILKLSKHSLFLSVFVYNYVLFYSELVLLGHRTIQNVGNRVFMCLRQQINHVFQQL